METNAMKKENGRSMKSELPKMAQDAAIQQELTKISDEFSVTEMDGLEKLNLGLINEML